MLTADHQRTVARVDFDDASGPLIETSVSGALEPLNAASARRALLRYPAMTLAVVLRIHWQALKLLVKKARFSANPPHPSYSPPAKGSRP